MNTRASAYVQAIRGPVVLVTIGVLFAIHQAGILSFGQTWPLLIIVIGLMKLFERVGSPAHARPGGGQPYAGTSVPGQGSGGRNA